MTAGRFIEDLHGENAYQGFAIEEHLYSHDSPYQKIEIFQSNRFGRVLVLDGIVQTTELDEFMYHEMLVHVPMFACRRPRTVLIIGGGDGGSLREALKHDIERVDMIEIDQQVISMCAKYLPTLNHAGAIYDDPRVNLIIDDAFAFLSHGRRRYDVIIIDSTDPVGPGEKLFSPDFYALCDAALESDGVISLQDGVVFLQREEARRSMRALRRLGLRAKCYLVAVPTYYGGPMTLGFATCDNSAFDPSLERILERVERSNIELRHYTPAHHLASFALPRWIEAITGESR